MMCVCVCAPACVVVYNVCRHIIYISFFPAGNAGNPSNKAPSNVPTLKGKKNTNYGYYRCRYFLIISGGLSKLFVLSPPRVIIVRPSRATYIIIKYITNVIPNNR